ncbi:hypothetical protein [Lentzea sp. NPDC060358]|uniref:hypothetical protein n=1 Tax=Lentzea sp. NPDC060358 TaxID=3347103 RepID=UPI0036591D28
MDVIEHIYLRYDQWHRPTARFSWPVMELSPRDTAPRPGTFDVLLHQRTWQVLLCATWASWAAWVLGSLVHVLPGPHPAMIGLFVFLGLASDLYTYAVVRREIRRRRLSPRR